MAKQMTLRSSIDLARQARFAAVALAVIAAGGAVASAADQPAGLILELTGASEPALVPFTEIMAGTKVKLGDDARFTFVHYGNCKEVTLVGGEVRIDGSRYMIRGGRVESERSQDCPQQIAVGGSGTAAAVVIRGGRGEPAISLRPNFVLAGSAAVSVTSVRFLADTGLIAELPMASPHFAWPEDRPSLDAGTVYRLEFVRGDGGTDVREFAAEDRATAKLLIIRVD